MARVFKKKKRWQQEKRRRMNYNRENLVKAHKEYTDGTPLSIRALARAYSVPETTLRDRIKGRVEVDAQVRF